MWVLFSDGTVPFPGMSNKEVAAQVVAGYRLEKPLKCPGDVYELMLKCWQVDTKARPTFLELQHALKSLYRQVTTEPTASTEERERYH